MTPADRAASNGRPRHYFRDSLRFGNQDAGAVSRWIAGMLAEVPDEHRHTARVEFSSPGADAVVTVSHSMPLRASEP